MTAVGRRWNRHPETAAMLWVPPQSAATCWAPAVNHHAHKSSDQLHLTVACSIMGFPEGLCQLDFKSACCKDSRDLQENDQRHLKHSYPGRSVSSGPDQIHGQWRQEQVCGNPNIELNDPSDSTFAPLATAVRSDATGRMQSSLSLL